jgi:hypothetical protein
MITDPSGEMAKLLAPPSLGWNSALSTKMAPLNVYT